MPNKKWVFSIIFKNYFLRLNKPFYDIPDIVSKYQEHQPHKEHKANYLTGFQYFFARLSTRYHLIQQEHHMAPVQCRDRKDVQEGQPNGKHGHKAPKEGPVPSFGHHFHDSDRALHLLIGSRLGIENYLELPDLIGQNLNGASITCRDGR